MGMLQKRIRRHAPTIEILVIRPLDHLNHFICRHFIKEPLLTCPVGLGSEPVLECLAASCPGLQVLSMARSPLVTPAALLLLLACPALASLTITGCPAVTAETGGIRDYCPKILDTVTTIVTSLLLGLPSLRHLSADRLAAALACPGLQVGALLYLAHCVCRAGSCRCRTSRPTWLDKSIAGETYFSNIVN